MSRVCFALVVALFCSACGKDEASPPPLPKAVAAPVAAPSLDVAEPPRAVSSDRAATPADLAPAPVERADNDATKRLTAAAQDVLVGEARGDQFVTTEVVDVLGAGYNPAVPDPPPPFSVASLTRWVQARARSTDICFEQHKRRNPARAPGALVVRIVLTPEGRVLDPKVTGDGLGDAALTECITSTLRRWRASPAPTAAQSFEVHLPFGTDDRRPYVVAPVAP